MTCFFRFHVKNENKLKKKTSGEKKNEKDKNFLCGFWGWGGVGWKESMFRFCPRPQLGQ